MNCPEYILKNGTSVLTHQTLNSTAGFSIRMDYLGNRRPDTYGVISGVVGGHGGDVYWVTHNPGTSSEVVTAYCWSEFELREAPKTLWDRINETPV